MGEVANMVTLGVAAQSKTAAPGGAAVPALYGTSVKMVAGTRNCLNLLLAQSVRVPLNSREN